MRGGKRDKTVINIKYGEQRTDETKGRCKYKYDKKNFVKWHSDISVPHYLFACFTFIINNTLLIRKSNRRQLEGGQEFRITTAIVVYFLLSASLDPG